MTTQQNGKRRECHTGSKRHPFGDRTTTRFLRTLPSFRVVHDLPDHLSELLKRLEQAEQSETPKRRG
jgi:hypothetical protein